MLPRPFARIVLGFVLAAAATLAWAGIPLSAGMEGVAVGARAEILLDPTRTLTLEDVRDGAAKSRFVPAPATSLNLGYQDTVLWVRLRLDRGVARGPWLLEVGYPMLDKVELHGPGRAQPFRSGDHFPSDVKAVTDRNLLFPVEAPLAGENTYFLRVESAGTMSVPLRLWDRDSFPEGKRDEAFVLGAYYGLLAAMVLYNLFLFAVARDATYAAYCLYVLAMGAVIGVNNGYGSLYLWPDAPGVAHWAQVSVGPLCCAMGALFTRLYLDTPHHARAMNHVLTGVMVVGLGFLPVMTLLPRFFVFALGHALALVTLVAMTIAGYLAWRRKYRPARYYIIAFTALIFGAALMVLRNLGIFPASALTDHGIQIGSALEAVLLSMGLADRISTLRREKEQAQGEALSSQHMLVETLRETERKLEHRVVERTGELETLNRSLQREVSERERTAALLKDSEERMRYQAQHDPLTGLPNRWLLRDRLQQAAARAKRDHLSFAVLMVDLDNFKAINDTLGHDVGDQLLVEVAMRLRGCIRERDTIARQGGDEFVFVLEGLTAPEDSAFVAAKIIEVLSQPVKLAGELLRTSPSIGISVYPDDGQDPDFLLKFADIAMYRAKSAGRNCYRFYSQPEPMRARSEVS